MLMFRCDYKLFYILVNTHLPTSNPPTLNPPSITVMSLSFSGFTNYEVASLNPPGTWFWKMPAGSYFLLIDSSFWTFALP